MLGQRPGRGIFFADLHVHSKYSRATAKTCDLEHLALWACKKGLAVVGTGDFTHPAYLAELKDQLVPAEPSPFVLAIAEQLIDRSASRSAPHQDEDESKQLTLF